MNTPSWIDLLKEAVSKPGLISEAYSRFHGYSIGNQILAMMQCHMRGIEPGPIATFMKWKELGRFVVKGQKAIVLCMPITCKRKGTEQPQDGTEDTREATFTRFVYRPNWFVLSQTEGADYVPAELPVWSEERALSALQIERVPFTLADGNVQGYASRRKLAISPVAAMPHKTLFHELAHVVLGHTEEQPLSDSETTPRSLREAEAESVAMICCESLGLPGAEYSRGYIQNWLAGSEIPDQSARKILSAADRILRVGRETTSPPTA